MTKQEVAELIQMNFILYKLGAKPMEKDELKAMLDVWFYHFKDLPAQAVKRAFLDANAVCTFPIQPADIFEQLKKRTKTPKEADWQAVKAALPFARKYDHWREIKACVGIGDKGQPIFSTGEKEMEQLFEELPASVKAWLGGVSGLRDLARCSESELDSYRRSEFLRADTDGVTDAKQLLSAQKRQVLTE